MAFNLQNDFLDQCIRGFQKSFKYKDALDVYVCKLSGYFIIFSNKQNLEYRLGFFEEQLFACVNIYQPCYPVFRLMNDQFWLKILEINRLGKFTFHQNVVFDKVVQSQSNKIRAKSSIFELIKIFVLAEEYNQQSVDMGSWDIEFDMEKSSNELMKDVVQALGVLYYLNNELFKKCTPQFISKNYLIE